MKPFVIVLLSALGMATVASAQSFTQRVQQSAQGEGTVTIHHDKDIDDLVNGHTLTTAQPSATQKTSPKGKTATKPKERAQSKDAKKQEQQPTQRPETAQRDNGEQPTDTLEQGSRRTKKVIGYRVQAFAGGNSRQDRQKAEQTGNAIKQLFPGEPVYVHYYAPRWICRVGNYRTYEEAQQMLVEIRKMGYESATIVKGKISVPY